MIQQNPFLAVGIAIAVVIVFVLFRSVRMTSEWNRAVVLRLGRFAGVRGPGLFLLLPLIDRVAFIVDMRVETTTITAEQALTRDTVAVGVDAIVFWQVADPRAAAINIANYRQAIERVAAIPAGLQDAMSRQAQAEREKQARVTLASAEQEIARQVLLAAELYGQNPVALQLRQMNLLYEMNKERGATVLIPTDMASALGAMMKASVPPAS